MSQASQVQFKFAWQDEDGSWVRSTHEQVSQEMFDREGFSPEVNRRLFGDSDGGSFVQRFSQVSREFTAEEVLGCSEEELRARARESV